MSEEGLAQIGANALDLVYAIRMKLRRSRLSAAQTRRLLEHFVAGTPARTSAELVGVNRNTATYFYHRLRELIAVRLESVSPLPGNGPAGVAERPRIDRKKGSTRSGAPGSVTVFKLLRRGGKVYTAMVPKARGDTLLPVVRSRLGPDAIVGAETLDIFDLLDVLGRRRQGVGRGDGVPRSGGKIGSVENFWSQARRNLRKYNGIPVHHFHLFLKECEWRFNYGSPRQLLETLERWIGEAP